MTHQSDYHRETPLAMVKGGIWGPPNSWFRGAKEHTYRCFDGISGRDICEYLDKHLQGFTVIDSHFDTPYRIRPARSCRIKWTAPK